MKKKIIYISASAIVLLAVFTALKVAHSSKPNFDVQTEKIGRGSIKNTVTATGTLEALTTVEVGTQVSGVVSKIYVDYNSQVKKGQLLAKIDETPLRAQLEQSKATVDDAEAELAYQKATYERYKVLAEKKLIAQSDYDLVVYNYSKAQANLNNAKSVYDKNLINLSYATIYSPINGIVLDRAVDEGQTVAASFNTPTLFTIANDLTQMQVEAAVDEADIGQVKDGQRVEFTVDAYPDHMFEGTVTEIRLSPVVTNNVVTYTVIIDAPNPDKKLMPGMTASITVFVNELNNILVVTGKAMRFSPDLKVVTEYNEFVSENSPVQNDNAVVTPPANMAEKDSSYNYVWVKKGALIEKQKIKTGETDEINYQLLSGLKEGDEVIVSLQKQTGIKAKTKAQSPFMPKRPGSENKK